MLIVSVSVSVAVHLTSNRAITPARHLFREMPYKKAPFEVLFLITIKLLNAFLKRSILAQVLAALYLPMKILLAEYLESN